MKIQIEGFTAKHDGRCIELRQVRASKKKPGTIVDRFIGYYPNMHQALCRLLEEKMAESSVTEVMMLAAEIKAFTDKISVPELLKAVEATNHER